MMFKIFILALLTVSTFTPHAFAEGNSKPYLLLEAEGSLTWDRTQQFYRARDNVMISYAIGENIWVINADEVEVVYLNNDPQNIQSLKAVGNVAVTQGNMTLRTSQLDGKMIRGELTQIQTSGGFVNITQAAPQRQEIQAKSGVYDLRTNVVTITGDVVIASETSRLTGERATYNVATGMSQIFAPENNGGASQNGRVRLEFNP